MLRGNREMAHSLIAAAAEQALRLVYADGRVVDWDASWYKTARELFHKASLDMAEVIEVADRGDVSYVLGKLSQKDRAEIKKVAKITFDFSTVSASIVRQRVNAFMKQFEKDIQVKLVKVSDIYGKSKNT